MDKEEIYNEKFVKFLKGLKIDKIQIKSEKYAIKLYRKILAEFLDIYVHNLDDFFASPAMFACSLTLNIDYLDVPEFIKCFMIDSANYTANAINKILSLSESKEYPVITKSLSTFMPKDTRILDVGAGDFPISTVYLGTNFDHKVVGMEQYPCFFSNETLSRFNAEVRKQTFTRKTNVDSFDLLAGFAPCDATIPLVENAKTHNKPYFIRLCECNDPEDWEREIKSIDPKATFVNDYAFNMDVTSAQMRREIEKQIYGKQPLNYDGFSDFEDFGFVGALSLEDVVDLMELTLSKILCKRFEQ